MGEEAFGGAGPCIWFLKVLASHILWKGGGEEWDAGARGEEGGEGDGAGEGDGGEEGDE